MAVRRERVLLEVEDNATNPLLRAAAAAKTLDKALDDVDGSTVNTNRDIDKLGAPNGSLSKAATQSRNLNKEIDRTSGRLRVLADAALLLGPALVPIGALAVPAITGLAAQAGAAALGVGTMVIAFQGVGDTLTAVNDAALEPTAENLEAARLAMQALSPEARELVTQIQDMRPAFTALRDAAAAGLFPGLVDALDDMERVFPNLERILFRVGDAAGDLGSDLGEALAGARGQEFLSFIEAEVPRALTDLGRIVGNLAAGMGELWMAFTPLNNDFSDWLLDVSRSFDDWASGLAETRGFQDFVAYIREAGPQVADAMGAIGNAVLQLVKAAAPLGGPTLAALEAVADVVAAIAGSSYGPALVGLASGLTLVSRAVKTLDALKATSLFSNLAAASTGSATSLTKMQGAGIAAAAGITAALAAGDKLVDLFREDLPGLEQLTGMLADLSSGEISSLPAEFDSLAQSIERITDPSFLKGQATSDALLGLFGPQGRTLTNATDEVEALEAALTNMLQVDGYQASESAFRVMAEEAGLTADQVAKLRDLMPGYTDALAGAQRQAQETGDGASAAGRRAAQGFDRAAGAAQRFKNALAEANAILTRRGAVTAYERAVDDLSKSFRQNGNTLDKNTRKGQDNRDVLDGLASSALKVAENLKGSNRIDFLKQARRDMVESLTKMGMNEGKARDLATRLLGLNKINAKPDVDVDTGPAISGIHAVLNELNQLDGKSATVTTYYETVGRSTGNFDRDHGRADGGTIGGSRYPYRDKVLTMLAPGEEVISNRNGQADRNRALLKAINANRYANGGTVGMRPSVSVAAPSVSVGNTQVRVFVDGREFRGMVRAEIGAHATHVERQNDRD